MTKGYPRTRFEIIDQTNVQEIPQSAVSSPIPMPMAVYTSDKGPEEWRLLFNLNQLTSQTGPMSFVKHGQAQLTVAEELRAGAVVLCKRMVSNDAKLANVTVRARVVVVENVSYVYFYTITSESTTFEEACENGQDTEAITDYAETVEAESEKYPCDVALFTVTPMGRGASGLYFRIVPEYTNSRSSTYLRYTFEVWENQELVESIVFTMNPDIIIDGISQAMNPKIKANSTQVRIQLYEDNLYTFLNTIVKTANKGMKGPGITPEMNKYSLSELVNVDFLNGYDRRGTSMIGGVVMALDSKHAGQEDPSGDLWYDNTPEFLKDKLIKFTDTIGTHLDGGTNGKMGSAPIQNPEEYKDMLLEVFGAKTEPSEAGGVEITKLFDPVIYDVDAYKIDFICDANFDPEVKKAIINMVEFRGDMAFLMDLGTKVNSVATIKEYLADNGFSTDVFSRYTAMYHNYCKIYDPYTSKQITVTMPYLLARRMINHISGGVGRPFAGILHNVTFPEIIENSINFLPVEVPGVDQKQMLVDMNVNYLMYYDSVPVMETMYTNVTEYTQLSYLHNIMAIQEVIKAIRTQCPKTRYTFMDGKDLQNYIDDATRIINQYSTNFKSISITYMGDERYESNNIFYATIVVQFKNFIQEEYFRVIAIS